MRLVWNRGVEQSFRTEGFFGREQEILALNRLAELGRLGEGGCILVYGPPNIGKSSLLLKFKQQLIEQREEVQSERRLFPFYFSFSRALANPFRLAHYFILEYMWQLNAFLGESVTGGFDAMELGERLSSLGITVPFDHIKGIDEFSESKDPVSAVATALTFPFVLGKGDIIDIFIFDDFHYSMKIGDMPEWAVLSVLRPYIKSGNFPFIISGSSPGIVTANLKKEGLFGSFTLMEIGKLKKSFAANHLRYLLERRKIELDEGIVEKIAARLGGVPIYQRLFVDEVTFSGETVKDDADIENLYAMSVVEGKLNRYWREFFESCMPDRKLLAQAIRLLKRILVDDFPINTYEGTVGLVGGDAERGERIISALEFKGLVKSDFEHLSFVRDEILSDFLFWAYERGVLSKPNSQVVSQIVQKNIFRSRYPRPEEQKSAALSSVKGMLRKWDCQEVPASLFDFASFRERYGTKGALEVLIGIDEEKVKERLPKISSVSTGYMVGGKLPRVDFDIVAFGFRNREYTEEALVIWAGDFISGKVLPRGKLEHFENRCRLLSLEKSLGSGQLVKWVLFDGTVDADTLAYASSCGICLTHTKQLKILFNLFDVDETLEEDYEWDLDFEESGRDRDASGAGAKKPARGEKAK